MIGGTLVRYLIVGVSNTVLGLGVIFVARQFVSDMLANQIGYLVVVPVSFMAHRNISFRDRGGRIRSFVRYVMTVTAGYMANYVILKFGLAAGLNAYICQSLAIGSHVAVTFVLSRLYVFLTPLESHP